MTMEKILVANLRELVDGYQYIRPIMLSTLSLNSYGEAHFFEQVFKGKRSFTVRKYDQLVQWFSDNWPQAAKWPAHLRRPSRSKKAKSA